MADPVSAGLEIGGEMLGAAVTFVAKLMDKFGPSDSIACICDDLSALLGQESASEIMQKAQLELAKKAAGEV